MTHTSHLAGHALALALAGCLVGVPVLAAGADVSAAVTVPARAAAPLSGSAAGPGTTPAQLQAVSALSPTDVWAVGTCHNKLALVKHWDGASWSRVLAPHPGTRSTLFGLSTLTASDIWVAGTFERDGFHTLVEHFDGAGWTILRTPSGPGANRSLYSVSADSASDVWTVGAAYDDTDALLGPIVQHWDGAGWTDVAGLDSSVTPRSVLALSADDVWVVGSSVNARGVQVTATYHWDGQGFSRESSTEQGRRGGRLAALAGTAADDVWAVGGATTEHWDGTQWSRQPVPGPDADVDLFATSGVSADDMWAVGNDASSAAPVIVHWDGTTWQDVSGPSKSGVTTLLGVSATSSTDAWVVGGQARVGGHYHTLVEHWDGSRWRMSS